MEGVKTNQTKPGTILIVDGNALARDGLRRSFEKAGYSVIQAEPGEKALFLARNCGPDAVLCALRTTEPDVGESAFFIRCLQEDPEPARSPLLVLTEEVDRERLPISCGGVADFLLLPIEEEALLEAARPHLDLDGADFAAPMLDAPGAAERDRLLRFRRCRVLSREVARRARRRERVGGPVPQLHSNQVGVLAAVAAARLGRLADLHCYLDKGFLPLDLDELEVIVTELVENACRFSERGSGIDVFFLKESGNEIYVRDHGRGIGAAAISAIVPFDGRVRLRARDGEGIGLPMVKGIVEARKGSFWISSTQGLGTTIRIHLPVPDSALPSAPAASGSTARPRRGKAGRPRFGRDLPDAT